MQRTQAARRAAWRGGLALAVCAFGAAAENAVPAADAPPALRTMRLGLSHPPVRDAEQLAFTAPHLAALNVRLIRVDESWRWREREPGKFRWAPLDRRMAFVREHGLSLLLTIQPDAPDWAAGPVRNKRSCVFRDDGAFRRYLDALLQRYAGRIDKIQFGNEWTSSYWFAGTPQDFTRYSNLLYDAVQAHSPGTQVVLGSFMASSLRALAALAGRLDHVYDPQWRKVTGPALAAWKGSADARTLLERVEYVLTHARHDIVDLHLYDDIEHWPAYVGLVRERLPGKPLIVSEFGGPNLVLESYSDAYQAERLGAAIRMLDGLGIAEAYYFKLAPSATMSSFHRKSTLLDPRFRKKPAYDVFRAFTRGTPATGPPDG